MDTALLFNASMSAAGLAIMIYTLIVHLITGPASLLPCVLLFINICIVYPLIVVAFRRRYAQPVAAIVYTLISVGAITFGVLTSPYTLEALIGWCMFSMGYILSNAALFLMVSRN